MSADRLSEPLFIAAASCVGPWGEDLADLLRPGRQPAAGGALPPVPRFVESNFPRIVSLAVGKLTPTLAPAITGFVLATAFGDTTTADVASRRLVGGLSHNPLLFYQSIPNSILGHLSKGTDFTGPLCCLSAPDQLLTHALVAAELTLVEGAADRVLIVGVDLAVSDRIGAIAQARAAAGDPLAAPAPAADIAVVLAVQLHPTRPGQPGVWIADHGDPVAPGPVPSDTASMTAFVEVCRAFAHGDATQLVADPHPTGTAAGYQLRAADPPYRVGEQFQECVKELR